MGGCTSRQDEEEATTPQPPIIAHPSSENRAPSQAVMPITPPISVRKQGLTILAEPKDAKEVIADIVFVHGLRGDPYETWLCKNVSSQPAVVASQCYWPKDLLANDFPQFRIATYGYEASITNFFKGGAAKSSISTLGNSLLNDLTAFRHNTISRDIIFIAHSLGGLVVTNALHRSFRAFAGHNDHQALHKATKGLVFMGTPHRGSDATQWGRLAARVVKASGMAVDTRLLDELSVDSVMLDDLRDDFTKLLNSKSISVVTLMEGQGFKGVQGLSGKIVEDASARLNIASEIFDHINANHVDMCRFSGPNDSGYTKMRGHITNLKQSLHPSIGDPEIWETGEYKEAFDLHRIAGLPSMSCTKLKVCVSSRPEQIFIDHQAFHHIDALQLEDHNTDDIKLVIRSMLEQEERIRMIKISEDREGHAALSRLEDSLTSAADGVFLWACLVVEELMESYRDGADIIELLHQLTSIPRDLSALYERILASIKEDYRPESRAMFEMLLCTFAACPVVDLTSGARCALSSEYLDSAPTIWATSAQHLDGLCRRVRSRCGVLVEVSGLPPGGLIDSGDAWVRQHSRKTIVRFVHRTVFTFLSAKYDLDCGGDARPASRSGYCHHLRLRLAAATNYQADPMTDRPIVEALAVANPHLSRIRSLGITVPNLNDPAGFSGVPRSREANKTMKLADAITRQLLPRGTMESTHVQTMLVNGETFEHVCLIGPTPPAPRTLQEYVQARMGGPALPKGGSCSLAPVPKPLLDANELMRYAKLAEKEAGSAVADLLRPVMQSAIRKFCFPGSLFHQCRSSVYIHAIESLPTLQSLVVLARLTKSVEAIITPQCPSDVLDDLLHLAFGDLIKDYGIPLHLSSETKDHERVIKHLLDCGANATSVRCGQSIFETVFNSSIADDNQYPCFSVTALDLLLNDGANPNTRCRRPYREEPYEEDDLQLVRPKPTPELLADCPPGWTTPLHQCVQWKSLEYADILLKHNADVNALDDRGGTVLDYAVFGMVVAKLSWWSEGMELEQGSLDLLLREDRPTHTDSWGAWKRAFVHGQDLFSYSDPLVFYHRSVYGCLNMITYLIDHGAKATRFKTPFSSTPVLGGMHADATKLLRRWAELNEQAIDDRIFALPELLSTGPFQSDTDHYDPRAETPESNTDDESTSSSPDVGQAINLAIATASIIQGRHPPPGLELGPSKGREIKEVDEDSE